MTQPSKYNRDTPQRHLPIRIVQHLKRSLDVGDYWRKLAAVIKDRQGNLKYGTPIIQQLEIEGTKPNRSPTELLLDNWRKDNPNIGQLIDALLEAGLERDANYLTENFLGQECVVREPLTPISNDTSTTERRPRPKMFYRIEPKTSPVKETEEPTLVQRSSVSHETEVEQTYHNEYGYEEDLGMKIIPFETLKECTDNFNDNPLSDGGRMIGQGGFGKVYLGRLTQEIAVKLVQPDKDQVGIDVEKEVKIMAKLSHENILEVSGFSRFGNKFCLVCPYMQNGSLQDRLCCKDDTEPLSVGCRVSIMQGTAKGLCYLHSNDHIHRDVKSANILLDINFVPKLGDFGVAREMNTTGTSKTSMTKNICGTDVYMPPEAFRGTVHVKWDSWSYGIVLLEVITGLPIHDDKRNEPHIRDHVEESDKEIFELVDEKVSGWDEYLVNAMYATAEKCLEERRNKRASMKQILEEILAWKGPESHC